ncbi:hypothetical protein MRX96_043779 [Rhipicephalus microplus]
MNSTTTEKPVERLRGVFASYGLPEEVVTDNRPQFTAKSFTVFLLKNGVRYNRTPPYHPASNGSAERCVQTVKRDLTRQLLDERSSGQSYSAAQISFCSGTGTHRPPPRGRHRQTCFCRGRPTLA